MMEWRFVSRIAALAVALPTTVGLLYWLFIHKDDDVEEEVDQRSGKVNTSRQTTIQITVPSKAAGTVIGAKGAQIKKIQEESGARVTFTDKDADHEGDEDRTILIRGDRESAQKAEIMIRQVIADMPTVVSEEVYVPGYCLGRLIGRGGETIRSMSRSSRCKIFIDRSQDSKDPEVLRTITITGTYKDIQLAKKMITDKVTEEEEFRSKDAAKGDNAQQRRDRQSAEEAKEEPAAPAPIAAAKEPEAIWDAGDQISPHIPNAEPMRESMEVFVSAVENCGHFWLQMVNKDALNLETLTEEMTAFYSNAETSEKYKLTEVKEGDVVASPFSDDSWYRAVVEVVNDGQVELYYFDFGDAGFFPLESLRELKPEFLSLPVQAIECKLANVKPTGEEWPEESSDVFEELTHCAEWVILQARTVGYVTVQSGQRPCVQLVNNNTSPPTDIAEAIVARGLALWEEEDSATTPPLDGASASPAASDTVRPELVPDPRPS